ncbi:MAG: hypothetical protein LBR89_00190 [Holosporales bacterium]|jgi:tetraacyldisaccharide-1-P 4'-kinase|nr:hypothetical protein [Holosporales bacterium]
MRCFKRSIRAKSITPAPIPLIAIDSIEKSTLAVEKMGVILSLAEQLTVHGHNPHVWIRSMNVRQARLVTAPSSPNGIGEDAFILSQTVPTWICSSPQTAAAAAAHAGASVLLLNERSERYDQIATFSIALVERDLGANVSASGLLAKSDGIITLSHDNIHDLRQMNQSVYFVEWCIPAQNVPGASVFGFTGLHDSGAFYHSLLKHRYNVKGFVPLLHMQRQEKQLQALLKMAASSGSILVTSDKDAPFLSKKMRRQVHVFPMSLNVDAALVNTIVKVIHRDDIIRPKTTSFG